MILNIMKIGYQHQGINMIKATFDNKKKKVVIYNERVTIVTLEGQIKNIPYECFLTLSKWLDTQSNVTIESKFYHSCSAMHFTVEGKAKRNPDDEFDPVLGERLAESRAKLKLYRFLYRVCDYCYKYYTKQLYGYEGSLRGRKKYDELIITEKEHFNTLNGTGTEGTE